jgi:hypothetical protein
MLVKKDYDGAVWLRQGEMYEIIAFYPHQVIPINNKDNNIDMAGQESIDEDLNKWFKEKWVNIGKKVDGKHPPCGTSGKKKGYAKCVPAAKAASMSKKEKENATERKRSAQNRAGRGGKDSPGQGKTPIYVSTKPKNEQMNLEEKLNLFLERNCPNDPAKWSASKAAAKSKFDVYPSAYANGWAAKNYKSKGGTWRKCNEGDMNGLYEGDINQDDQIDEYDVETNEEVQDFAQYIKEYVNQLSEAEITEAEYQGRKVQLGKPMQGDVKKFKVYVRNPEGRVVKVNFGQKGMVIKKNNPERRRNFRARHNCSNPGPRTKARYWSCRKW